MFYLKYRPQTISELDNERIKQTLGKALLSNEWAHAYLLIGTRGSGKTTTARLIAKIVNCTNRKKGEEPCNKCDSCVAITQGRSLDVIEIDAASNTGVEDIRELRERVKLAPTSSKYKVYIIDEVHMLSNSAFNALLKTLEEPPGHVIFVLATTDPQKLPATIVSRCLVYDFGRATKDEIVSSLKRKIKEEKTKTTPEALEMIAERADGSFRDADKLLEQLSLEKVEITAQQVERILRLEARQRVPVFLETLAKRDLKTAIKIVEELAQEGASIKSFNVECLGYLQKILLLRAGINSEVKDIPALVADDVMQLIRGLTEANGFFKDSPVVQLPLEMVIVEFCGHTNFHELTTNLHESKTVSELQTVKEEKKEIMDPARMTDTIGDTAQITAKWSEILNAVKPYNHNLSALLRSSKPKKFDGRFLTIEVFYKFHMDKLSEIKNREILENVVSGILGGQIKVKFELSQKKAGE